MGDELNMSGLIASLEPCSTLLHPENPLPVEGEDLPEIQQGVQKRLDMFRKYSFPGCVHEKKAGFRCSQPPKSGASKSSKFLGGLLFGNLA